MNSNFHKQVEKRKPLGKRGIKERNLLQEISYCLTITLRLSMYT
jgi:hypothetical protein